MKQIIEAFNNVLELVEQQEKELDDFMAEEDEVDAKQRRRSRGSSLAAREESKESDTLDSSQPS